MENMLVPNEGSLLKRLALWSFKPLQKRAVEEVSERGIKKCGQVEGMERVYCEYYTVIEIIALGAALWIVDKGGKLGW